MLLKISVRTKPLFWFGSDTETKTQIGRCVLLADTATDTKTTFQRENLVIDSMGYFFHHKGASKIKYAAKY